MKRLSLLSLFLFATTLLHAESVHFRFDVSADMQRILTDAFYDFLSTIPEADRPTRFAVGKSMKDQKTKPVLEIAADLPANAMPYAVNGTIFAVSKKNPVKTISKIQADSILAGKLTHWEDSDKKKKAVIFCIYSPSAPTTRNHSLNIPGGLIQHKTYFQDLELLTLYVNGSKDAIAILPVRCFNLKELHLLAPDNIPCTMETVMSGKYPYATIYRIRWDKKNPIANKLAEYLLSPRVKLRIHQVGDMPLRPNQK